MATLGNTFLNLIDMMKNDSGSDKAIASVAEMLAQNNPQLDDAIAVECNSGSNHKHSIRTGLPEVAWGAIYQGMKQSKSQRQTVEDTTGFLEGLSTVDERLLELFKKNQNAVRLSEAMAFIESMNQSMGLGMFYQDTATTPEAFKGLGARYNVIGGGGAGNQVIDGGGIGSDNTSIWFVTWSEYATHLIYPEGTQAGVKREDMGRQRVLDAEGRPYYVREEMFRWHLGLSVRDWRYNARVANVDISEISDGTTNVYDLMREGYYKMLGRKLARTGNNMNRGNSVADPSVPIARTAIYMNTDVLAALDKAQSNSTGTDNFVRLVPKEIEGKEVLTYRGIPIRETDSLLNTEAVVPAAA
jgi:hypothetical protein